MNCPVRRGLPALAIPGWHLAVAGRPGTARKFAGYPGRKQEPWN